MHQRSSPAGLISLKYRWVILLRIRIASGRTATTVPVFPVGVTQKLRTNRTTVYRYHVATAEIVVPIDEYKAATSARSSANICASFSSQRFARTYTYKQLEELYQKVKNWFESEQYTSLWATSTCSAPVQAAVKRANVSGRWAALGVVTSGQCGFETEAPQSSSCTSRDCRSARSCVGGRRIMPWLESTTMIPVSTV
jgi:hypothetical protein